MRRIVRRAAGEVLQRARKRAGITQTELADILSKPQPFISAIEGGTRTVKVAEFIAIAYALEADPRKLFAQVVKKMPDDIPL